MRGPPAQLLCTGPLDFPPLIDGFVPFAIARLGPGRDRRRERGNRHRYWCRSRGLEDLHRLAVTLPGVAFVAHRQLRRLREQREVAFDRDLAVQLVEGSHHLVADRLEPLDLVEGHGVVEGEGVDPLGSGDRRPARSPVERHAEQVERLRRLVVRPVAPGFERLGQAEPGVDEHPDAVEGRLELAGDEERVLRESPEDRRRLDGAVLIPGHGRPDLPDARQTLDRPAALLDPDRGGDGLVESPFAGLVRRPMDRAPLLLPIGEGVGGGGLELREFAGHAMLDGIEASPFPSGLRRPGAPFRVLPVCRDLLVARHDVDPPRCWGVAGWGRSHRLS